MMQTNLIRSSSVDVMECISENFRENNKMLLGGEVEFYK